MQAMRLRAIVWLLLALALAAAALVKLSGPLVLQSNLLALLPPTERNAAAEEAVARLAEAAGNRAFFLIGAKTPESSSGTGKAAREFAARLRESGVFRQVVAEAPPFDARQLPAFYRQYRFNLLSDADRKAFAEGSIDLAGRLQRKLFAPFQFGAAFALTDDPFGLADAWLNRLPLKALKLEPHDGLLMARDGENLWFVVSAELSGSAYDSKIQDGAERAIASAEESLRKDFPGLEILRTGTVFYATAARKSAEREFDLIGAGSLIGMLLLLYVVFRSLRPLALGLLSVGFGVATAVMVTLAVFDELHLITLVFGASLIGEAIDYAVQYFAAHLGAGSNWEPISGLRRIAPGLLMALATSVLGYAALMLSPFPALSQIALFAVSGLIAACMSVFLLLPWLLKTPGRRDPDAAVALPRRFLAWWSAHVGRATCTVACAVLLVVAVPGWMRLASDDDVHLLISRPAQLVAQEDRIRELTGFGNGSQFFLIEGKTTEEVLRNEEKLLAHLDKLVGLKALDNYIGISAFVPSGERQQENRSYWEQAVFSDASGLRQLLSEASLRDDAADRLIGEFRAAAGAQLRLDAWLESPLSAPFRHLWLGKSAGPGGYASIVQPQGIRDLPRLAEVADDLPGVTFVDKAGSVSRLFGEYRRWGALWLLGALALVYGVLFLRYGLAQAAFTLLPTLLSIGLVLGVFGYFGVLLTLFNLMGFILVLGVGVNYAIFLREGGVNAAATLAGVLLSAGTTLLSFGLLSFSSMPALSGFGLTLLLGISMSVLLAPMILSFVRKAPA
jgi:predicted exporter